MHEIAVGDFTGDGKLDIVLSYFLFPLEDRTTPIRLLAGNGSGGFSDQTATFFPGGAPATTHARETAVADFNGDGRPDLYIADQGLDGPPFPGGQNTLFLSSGATGLTNAVGQLPARLDFTHSAEAIDVDRDGDMDIYVGDEGGKATPYFLINDGQGHFTPDTSRLPSNVGGAPGSTVDFTTEAFLDVNGDGAKDLFLGAARQSGVNMLLMNDGTGHFTEAPVRPPLAAAYVTGSDAVDAQSADVNGDGRPDLIVAYSISAGIPQRYVQILISRGDGTFADESAARLPASIEVGGWSRRVFFVDVNGDGAKDIVLSNASTTPLYINDGTGHFVEMPAGVMSGDQFDQFAPGDFNGDGRIDFLSWKGTFGGDSFEHLRVDLGRNPGLTQVGTAAGEGLMGTGGSDTINGGAGDDVIVKGAGGASSYLRGDDGNDQLFGGSGFDDINGNMGNDTVHGNGGDDYSVGGKDNDLLFGDDGDDIVWGNLGNDTCDGGNGNDQVRGGQGDDSVSGGAGNDFISGDRGNDTESGGAGADIFHASQDVGIDRVLDFHLSEGDRVQLDPGTTSTISQVGADTVIDFGAGSQMILVGVTLSSLTGNWIFGA